MADSPRRPGGSSDNSRNNSRGRPSSGGNSGYRGGPKKPGSPRSSGGPPSAEGGPRDGARNSGGYRGSGGSDRAGGERGGRPDRPDRSNRTDRTDRPNRTDRPERSGRPERTSAPRDGSRTGGGRPPGADTRRSAGPRADDRDRPRREEDLTPTPVFPDVDEDVEPKQLDRIARRDLTTLDKAEAEFVANHLVMAARLIDDDVELAHQHALAALHKGSRIPVVRETLGITAYLRGDFALALRELRTHRRLTGKDVNVPMMVDCERGLGRPQRGIELARSTKVDSLDTGVRVELAIALSGARLDLEQPDRALLELQIPELNPNLAFSYSPALFDAYAVVLDELGRSDEAATWGNRAHVAARALAEAEGAPDDIVVVDIGDDDDVSPDLNPELNPDVSPDVSADIIPEPGEPGSEPGSGNSAPMVSDSETPEPRGDGAGDL